MDTVTIVCIVIIIVYICATTYRISQLSCRIDLLRDRMINQDGAFMAVAQDLVNLHRKTGHSPDNFKIENKPVTDPDDEKLGSYRFD